ncbi:Bifunctional epoxide hydrolase 2 [Cytospora mali]|uniref:Bifunctional epoxide hydrolase 2 n=1 Tax=Cytospora mali TaxID=578113 RepID=A0A194V7N6_CYTMA|nr:Bifunctional epoxide hydrolase 2 [Valsa mali var. pyri (nom. inval.)]
MAIAKLKPNDPGVQSLTANVRGKTYKYILAKPEGTPRATALLIHGWPDLGFGWRYQVPLLTRLGLQVIVPDMLGYGGTDAPQDIALYSLKSVCDDMAELVHQVIGHDETIILGGHDWGGALVWRFALWHPELLRGVFSVCTPYVGPSPQYIDYPTLVKLLPNFRYQIQLSGPDVEREIGSDPAKIRGLLAGIYGGEGSGGDHVFTTDHGVHFDRLDKFTKSTLLDDEELDFYVEQYSRNGIRGPVNWYRTRQHNYEEELALLKDGQQPKIKTPAMIIVAKGDVALLPKMSEGMEAHFDSLKRVLVDGSHWALWDATESVNAEIKAFVEQVLGPTKASI